MATNGKEIDVTIGGVDFRLATSKEIPESVETIPIRKDQLDVEPEPGEQSLSQWWRRSQDSFHHGAGWLWAEGSNDGPHFGFWSSVGFDVFTRPGEVSVLRRLVPGDYTGLSLIKIGSYTDPTGDEYMWAAAASTVYYNISDPSAGVSGALTKVFGGGLIRDCYVAGDYIWVTVANGDLVRYAISTGTMTIWPLTGSVGSLLAWGKHRLWACGGRYIFQPNTEAAPGTAQAPIFTNPNPAWNYNAIIEGPQAMYFAGNDGVNSTIQAVALDSGGGVPTLTGAQMTVSLPPGELVQKLAVLANQYIGIGTNKGFRIGIFDGVHITYGPLILHQGLTEERFDMEAPLRPFTHCAGVVAHDKYFFVCLPGSGFGNVVRVDTSQELFDGVFPWSRDYDANLQSLAIFGDRLMGIRASNYIAYVHPSELCPGSSGNRLMMSRIGFRTHENKIFHSLAWDVEWADSTDSIGLAYAVVPNAWWGGTASIGQAKAQDLIENLAPSAHIGVQFALYPSTIDNTTGPRLSSIVLKAVPSVKPARLLVLPLLCYDRETAASGREYGHKGHAMERFAALQALEDVGDLITYTDHRDGTTHQVVIESLRFVQQSTGVHPGTSGKGGILIAQLRTMDS